MTKKEFIVSLDRLSLTPSQKEGLLQRLREPKRRGGNQITSIWRYVLAALAIFLCLSVAFGFPLWKGETELERQEPTASQADLAMVTDYFVFQGKVYVGEQKSVSEQAVGKNWEPLPKGALPICRDVRFTSICRSKEKPTWCWSRAEGGNYMRSENF